MPILHDIGLVAEKNTMAVPFSGLILLNSLILVWIRLAGFIIYFLEI